MSGQANSTIGRPADFVEIVSPIADAIGVLADLIPGQAASLAGASIAKSAKGTLLLNPHAWHLFEEGLRKALPNLIVVEPAREESKPIRFIITAPPHQA